MLKRGCQWLHSASQLHTSCLLANAAKSNLAKLRRQTGFSISQCKKALEKFENDIAKSEAWLREQAQKEGWAKALKLQGRPMSQGLVGIIAEDNMASMVEVNCETDFVAKNEKFRGLVDLAAAACLQHAKSLSDSKVLFDKAAVNGLSVEGGRIVSDLVALEVGNIGENMAVTRGIVLKASEGMKLGTYIHSMGSSASKDSKCSKGKYGAIVTFQQSASSGAKTLLPPSELGRQLGQHVVGMNPRAVGNNDSEAIENKDEEMTMVHQEFLLEPTLTVAEFLEQNRAEVCDFVRFECGEVIESESESKS